MKKYKYNQFSIHLPHDMGMITCNRIEVADKHIVFYKDRDVVFVMDDFIFKNNLRETYLYLSKDKFYRSVSYQLIMEV